MSAAQKRAQSRRRAAAAARARRQAEARRKAKAAARARAQAEARRKAAAEARRRAQEAARRRAQEEARRRAAAEVRRRAEEEARRKAALEAKRRAEAEARRKASLEAKLKAEREARLKAAAEAARQRAAAALEAERKAAARAAQAEKDRVAALKRKQSMVAAGSQATAQNNNSAYQVSQAGIPALEYDARSWQGSRKPGQTQKPQPKKTEVPPGLLKHLLPEDWLAAQGKYDKLKPPSAETMEKIAQVQAPELKPKASVYAPHDRSWLEQDMAETQKALKIVAVTGEKSWWQKAVVGAANLWNTFDQNVGQPIRNAFSGGAHVYGDWVSNPNRPLEQEARLLVQSIPSITAGSWRTPVPVFSKLTPGGTISFGTVTSGRIASDANPNMTLNLDGEPTWSGSLGNRFAISFTPRSDGFNLNLRNLWKKWEFTERTFDATLSSSVTARVTWGGFWNTIVGVDVNNPEVQFSSAGVKGRTSSGFYYEQKPGRVLTYTAAVPILLGGLAMLVYYMSVTGDASILEQVPAW